MIQNTNFAIEGTAATSHFGDFTARDALDGIARVMRQTLSKETLEQINQ